MSTHGWTVCSLNNPNKYNFHNNNAVQIITKTSIISGYHIRQLWVSVVTSSAVEG